MTEAWYRSGGTGEIQVSHIDAQWTVSEPTVDSKTICLFTGGEPTETEDEIQIAISVEVQSFRMGLGNNTNYLMVELTDADVPPSESESSQSDVSPEANVSKGDPERKLTELRGSGEYVTVECIIEEIEFVAKDTQNTPDLKGVVREEGSTKRVPLVVSDGVSHPHFGTGETIRFHGVKDHKYAKKNENQLLVTDYTDFTKIG